LVFFYQTVKLVDVQQVLSAALAVVAEVGEQTSREFRTLVSAHGTTGKPDIWCLQAAEAVHFGRNTDSIARVFLETLPTLFGSQFGAQKVAPQFSASRRAQNTG
jgi:hypothetical protein